MTVRGCGRDLKALRAARRNMAAVRHAGARPVEEMWGRADSPRPDEQARSPVYPQTDVWGSPGRRRGTRESSCRVAELVRVPSGGGLSAGGLNSHEFSYGVRRPGWRSTAPSFSAEIRGPKKLGNISLWVEKHMLAFRAVDPGCRPMRAGGLRWPLLSGSGPAGEGFESQSQITGRDLESPRRGVWLCVSGRPAQF